LFNQQIPKNNFDQIYFAFFYFDAIIGPAKFYSVPNNLEDLNKNYIMILSNLMDMPINLGYFEQFQNNKYFYGYIRYIHSPWARGEKEQIFFCVICEKKFDNFIFQPIFERYADKIEYTDGIYMAFYVRSEKHKEDKEDIIKNYEKLKLYLKMCYKECLEVAHNIVFANYLLLGLKEIEKVDIINSFYKFIKENLAKIEKNNEIFSIKYKVLKYFLDNSIFNVYDLDPELKNICYSNDFIPDSIIYVLKYSEDNLVEDKKNIHNFIEHFFGEDCVLKLSSRTPILILILVNDNANEYILEDSYIKNEEILDPMKITDLKRFEELIISQIYEIFEFKLPKFRNLNLRVKLVAKDDLNSLIKAFIWTFDEFIHSI